MSKNKMKPEKIGWGFGCHLNAAIALERALTELNQCTLFEIEPDEQLKERKFGQFQWLYEATVENQPYLRGTLPLKTASDYAAVQNRDLLEMIGICQHKIEEQGMEVLMLDLTRKEIGLNVVRMIVPGLRHFSRSLGPGRLYDVPLRMGWLQKSLQESELNPYSPFR